MCCGGELVMTRNKSLSSKIEPSNGGKNHAKKDVIVEVNATGAKRGRSERG